mmetsp:Transcript_26163/g.66443  ORF Transcript_26163/g.66443 Transcript_26163/m.66443 type:complete len:210 (-) Transcript_26163:352-981(-)
MAKAGPIPISEGGTPATAYPRKTPMMFEERPRRSAACREARTMAAAPSLTWLLLPAVVVPPSLNAARSLASPSTLVPSRTPSSISTTEPSASFTGTISARKRPSRCACAASACERTAKASCSAREMPYFSAIVSEVIPIGTRQSAASGDAKTASCEKGGRDSPIALALIDSTPAAIPTSMWPARMAAAMSATACRPEEHCRLTVAMGTE